MVRVAPVDDRDEAYNPLRTHLVRAGAGGPAVRSTESAWKFKTKYRKHCMIRYELPKTPNTTNYACIPRRKPFMRTGKEGPAIFFKGIESVERERSAAG